LASDASGNLYGPGEGGGSGGDGGVFQLTPSASIPWPESVIFNFSGTDGSIPLPMWFLIPEEISLPARRLAAQTTAARLRSYLLLHLGGVVRLTGISTGFHGFSVLSQDADTAFPADPCYGTARHCHELDYSLQEIFPYGSTFRPAVAPRIKERA